MLHRVALVRTDISEELSSSFFGVTRISELGTTLAATSNRRTSVHSWLRHSTTSRKVTGSIPDEVIEFFQFT
jgi:hypothetical protein